MLPLPRDPRDPLKLADWLELYALVSGDRNSSYGDLVTALKAASIINPREITADELPTIVFEELAHREKAAIDAYPFEVVGGVVRCKKRPLSYAHGRHRAPRSGRTAFLSISAQTWRVPSLLARRGDSELLA